MENLLPLFHIFTLSVANVLPWANSNEVVKLSLYGIWLIHSLLWMFYIFLNSIIRVLTIFFTKSSFDFQFYILLKNPYPEFDDTNLKGAL